MFSWFAVYYGQRRADEFRRNTLSHMPVGCVIRAGDMSRETSTGGDILKGMRISVRRCENCGSLFDTEQPTQFYCDDNCRIKRHARLLHIPEGVQRQRERNKKTLEELRRAEYMRHPAVGSTAPPNGGTRSVQSAWQELSDREAEVLPFDSIHRSRRRK